MKHKKAVSPVVATLLLILIAVAASLVLYAWVSSLSSEAKGSGAERTGAAFVVEAAKIDANAGNVTVYIRNVGSVPIENGTWSLYVLDPTTGTVVSSNTSWTFGQTIGPGELVDINVTGVTGLTADEYYIVKVVSPQGQADSAYVKAE